MVMGVERDRDLSFDGAPYHGAARVDRNVFADVRPSVFRSTNAIAKRGIASTIAMLPRETISQLAWQTFLVCVKLITLYLVAFIAGQFQLPDRYFVTFTKQLSRILKATRCQRKPEPQRTNALVSY
jgi:hypothetical protein